MKQLGELVSVNDGSFKAFKESSKTLWDMWEFGDIPPEVLKMRIFLSQLGVRPDVFPNPADYHYAVLNGHAQTTWASYGYPTFELSGGTASSMLLTDPSSVPWEDVAFPFSTFSVLLPYPDTPLHYTDTNGASVPAQHLLFHRYRAPPSEVDLKSTYDMGGWSALDALHEDAFFVLLMGPKDPVSLWDTYKVPSEGARAGSFLSMLGKDWFDTSVEGTPSKLDSRALKASGRLIVNTAIHVANLQSKGLWSPSGQRSKGKKSFPRRHWALNSIKLVPALRKMADTRFLGEPQWKVEARHLVRGHWKNQSCGKGGLERRRLKIEPYWRGPEDGPVFPKPIMKVADDGS